MARFKAFSAFNVDNFNLYFYESAYDGDEILDNVNASWSAGDFTTATYTDIFYSYGLSDTDVSWALGAAGPFFYYEGFPVGTAGALSEWNDGGTDTWVINWILDGVAVSLTDLIEAVITPTGLDDAALLIEALSGNDTIELSDGDDVFNGFDGRDTIDGGAGSDVLYGERRADIIYGGTGFDDLYGGSGSDRLYGDADNDYLGGGSGDDVLEGGTGIDWSWGGPGDDSFVYKSIADAPLGGEYDIISFFVSGEDKIVLSRIDANRSGSASGNQAFTFIGTAEFNGNAGRLRYDVIDADSDGAIDDILITGTVNADKTADFAIAVLNRTSIEATDFIL